MPSNGLADSRLCIEQPRWLLDAVDFHEPCVTPEERMALAIRLAALNIENGGGPFGACVFDMSRHLPIAVGVNRVTATGLSVAHAEMLALMGAQRALSSWTLRAESLPECELVTSAEPCVQCFGGIYWSGISSLLCGARKSDVGAIGFDEGPRPHDWVETLQRRGIRVRLDLLREEAVRLLERYRQQGGTIYNP